MNTNSNNAAQTLFRLASLRSPQLTETKRKNLGFIHRPDVGAIKGFFDGILETWSSADGITKFTALEKAAKSFIVPEAFTMDKNLEAQYPALANLGKTICRKEEITNELVNKAQTEWNNKTSNQDVNILINELRLLWDNLIYQTVTQQDFNIKEIIIQIIKAIHYLDANKLERTVENIKINGEDFREKAMSAVVVFPDALVGIKASEEEIPFTVNKSKINNGRIKYAGTRDLSPVEQSQLAYMANVEVKTSGSLLKKEALEVFRNELVQEQKEYNESSSIAYKEQYVVYEKSIQPELDRYDRDCKVVEATFTAETTSAQKEAAYQTIQPINIPEFKFLYPNEIDLVILKSKLSKTSFNLFIQLFTDLSEELQAYISENPDAELVIEVTSPNGGEINGFAFTLKTNFKTFTSVLTSLNSQISENFTKAVSLKAQPEKRFANMGGVLIPVASNVNISPNLYFLQISSDQDFFREKHGYLHFGFTVQDSSWSVSAISLSITIDQGQQMETFQNIAVSDGKINIPAVYIPLFRQVGPVSINILFDNGSESTLNLGILKLNTDISGVLNIIKSSNKTDTPSVFQPKHFGVKRLGIADYLKVEQSIHAYVPGEVSNIENVMASELRHKSSTAREYSEVTENTSKSQETEKLSDTTKTSRTDMQTEVARELEKEQSYDAHTRFGKSGQWYFEVGGTYATNTAQHESTRQAVTKSQEITARALDRVLTKISEERVEKIIREYTETNVHEYDNRGRVTATTDPAGAKPQHISGVYRWVDKKMKNQIYNYGKRMMFEFMIPEPARLHVLATKSAKKTLVEPLDPRKALDFLAIKTYNDITEEKLKYWLKFYPEIDVVFPAMTVAVPFSKSHEDWSNDGRQHHSTEFEINLPENYKLDTIKGMLRVREGNSAATFRNMWSETSIAGQIFKTGGYQNDWPMDMNFSTSGEITGNIHVTVSSWDIGAFNYTMMLNCSITPAYLETWKIQAFNKLIAAYEAAYKKFSEEQAAINEQAAEKEKENNEKAAIFYRSTESNILKHNCIAYLLRSYNALGLAMSEDDGEHMKSFAMKLDDNLDQYTAIAKFMEQAFEWNVMDYTFYPYYWANANNWDEMYTSDELNPLFRSFLQAGMARVIVTVKPGFEDAVQFFMNTGRVWNGGEVPVIGDPLYLSIVDELRAPQGVPQGKYWITRVPTTLTILQAKSTGLEVEDALPIFPESDPENCENPQELETKSAFGLENINMLSSDKEGSTLLKYLEN